jgi:hypothetical protein
MSSTDFLSIHYFKTTRVRHWVSQELFLSPEFLTVKLYATIANIGVEFVLSSYPNAAAFGAVNLPAAFIDGKTANFEEIIRFFTRWVDLDKHVKQSSKEEREALRVHTEEILGEAIKYNLWGHNECFLKFTRPVMKDSMPRPYVHFHCANRRRDYMHKDLEVLDGKLKAFLKYLNSKLLTSKFFFPAIHGSNEAPSLCDVILYAHLSVLLSIPEKFSPWHFANSADPESREIIDRLRSYLLDFDDFLWQLNSQRAEELNISGPICTASKAALIDAKSAGDSGEPDTDEVTDLTSKKPFLGNMQQRMHNILFLVGAFAAMGSVVYFSKQ